MAVIKITLTEDEAKGLEELSSQTGKSVTNLIRDAIARVTKENRPVSTRSSLQIAKGIWKDRTDLPEFRKRDDLP